MVALAYDPRVSPEVFALVKKLDASVVGTKYTIDGEVYVCRKGGKKFELPLEIEPLREDTLDKKALKDAMRLLHIFVEHIRSIGRVVPPLQSELKAQGLGKKVIRQLESAGYVARCLMPLQSAETKTVVKTVYCTYFTSQGRAWVREHIDREYGRIGHEHWESVREHAEQIRAGCREQKARSGGDHESVESHS